MTTSHSKVSNASDTTPHRVTRSTLNRMQYDFCIKVPPRVHPDKADVIAIKSIFDKMKDVNTSVQISPWSDQYIAPILKKTCNIPTLIRDMIVYFL